MIPIVPPPTPPALPGSFVLSADDRRMMLDRASIIAASCGVDGTTQLMRALGCRFDDSGRVCTILLGRAQSQALLDDVAANGRIAVVFARPTTDRSIQLKADDARVEPALAGDRRLVDDYLIAMTEELKLIGYSAAFTAAMLAGPFEQVVAIRFTPSSAYHQTPGAGAGEALPRSGIVTLAGPPDGDRA